MSDTQSKIQAAQKKYDDLADKTAKLAKEDKQFRARLDADVKDGLKKRFGDRDKLMAEKSAAHRELVDLQRQREGEIVAGVDKASIKPEDAKKELVSLGHTEASADIQLARAMNKPPLTVAPGPKSDAPTAPIPERDSPPKADPNSAPLKVQDPISAKVPESQTVIYKDPATKTPPAVK